MNGPQDVGGQHGFGPIAPEPAEPVFHADWERRALALTLAAGAFGAWTLDESRHARESLPPADYYRASYYEIWITALERLLVRHGFVSEAELASGHAAAPAPTPKHVLRAGDVAPALARGATTARDPGGTERRFDVGDPVRARLIHPEGHTRLPRYVRGRPGRIVAVQGCHVFPDSHAHGGGEAPQWLYGVVFDGRALWGGDADPHMSVTVDAWESYLDPA